MSHTFRSIVSAAALISVCGLAACTYSTANPHARGGNGAGVDLPDSTLQMSPVTTTAAAPTTNAYSTPTTNTGSSAPIANRPWTPGQKLEPFWISMTAEADRAKWDDQFTAPNANAGMASTGNSKSMSPESDDIDGLMHITLAPEGADFDPCVAPDGSFIVFASTQHRPTADIYVKSSNGRTITQLTTDAGNDVMPSISPDGSRIAFASNRNGNWDIYVMAATGGQALQVTGDQSQELHPSWSSDGKRLVFCRLGEVSGRWEMWVTDLTGSSSTEFVGFGMFPEWCPTPGTGLAGRDKILFQRSRERGDRAFSLWTIDYRPGDTSSPTEVVSASGQAAINASWSPDGTRIVYATIENKNDLANGAMNPGAAKLPNSNLWMTAIDGTQKVNLTAGNSMNLMPVWGADNRIYFVSDRTGVPNIWSLGTEKAIVAATGKPMTKTVETASRKPAAEQPQQPAPAAAHGHAETEHATVPTE